MKKLIYFLLITALIVCCTTPVHAEEKTTELTLEANGITDVGNRHIKVRWEKVEDTNLYQLELADNDEFENAVIKRTNRLYWNFASVPGDKNGTYYIRVKPIDGQWSNVVVAELKYVEPKPIDPEALEKIDWFPWIPKGIDWNKLLNAIKIIK